MSTATLILVLLTIEGSLILLFVAVCRYLYNLDNRIDNMTKVYSEAFENLSATYKTLSELDEAKLSVYNDITDSYKKMYDLHKIVVDAFHKQEEIDKHIIETWRGVEEQYSNTYEQFRLCIDKLEGVDKAYADLYAKLQHIEDCVDIFEYKDADTIGMELTCDDCCVNCDSPGEADPETCALFAPYKAYDNLANDDAEMRSYE